MKIVILTNSGSLYGKKIINEFLSRSISIEAVIVIKQPFSYYIKLFKYVKKRVGFVEAIYFSFMRTLHTQAIPSIWNGKSFIEKYADMPIPVYFSKGTNSEETLTILKKCRPDIVVLGQTGIVHKNLLLIPTHGSINAHPGMLPLYRGIDCAKWAILNNDFENIGCSVHWVNSGVDTGNIILRSKLSISKGDTLDTIDVRLENLSAQMITQVILLLNENKNIPVILQKKDSGVQYYKMSRQSEHITKEKLYKYLKSIS